MAKKDFTKQYKSYQRSEGRLTFLNRYSWLTAIVVLAIVASIILFLAYFYSVESYISEDNYKFLDVLILVILTLFSFIFLPYLSLRYLRSKKI